MEGVHQPLSDEVLSKLREIVAWLERDARDQFKDLDHFEDMLESIIHLHLGHLLCAHKARFEETALPPGYRKEES
jgi:hypothetical protein